MNEPSNKTIRIKRGPQFGGKFSIVYSLASVGLFIVGVNSIILGERLVSIVCLVGITILIPIFLDYKGIEIDLKQQRIRIYSSFLGWRFGSWISTVGFDEVELKWERILYRSGGTPVFIGGLSAIGLLPNTRHSDLYCIYLRDYLNGHKIEVANFQSYKAARKFLNEYSNILGLRPKDSYKKVREKAMKRRNEIESRRRR